MRDRCLNPRCKNYKEYGGRGITICKRWASFAKFLADMGEVKRGLTLDRINNDKGYSPKNCRWATRAAQGLNKRNNIRITFRRVTLPLAEWSRRTGINEHTLHGRRARCWPVHRMLTERPS